MKKLKKILRKLKNNAGSSIVMVVVAIAFIGIVVGALLSAAVQSYRLKLAELNSKDNFYYIEQALNEIYAGVGTQTVEDLQNAYVYTVENMVRFDLGKGRYVTESEETIQKMFTSEFYRRLSDNEFFKSKNTSDLAEKLETFISNDTVSLDASRLQIVDYRENGENVGKIIKNVTLKRTQEYNRSSANGVFTQSITTDIVIGKPDFAVRFDAVNDQDPNIFKYALVADMGVYVDQKTTPLTIAGNIYAASDYYNKNYNEKNWDDTANDADKKFGKTGQYLIDDLTKPVTADTDADSSNEDGSEVAQQYEKIDLSSYYVHGSVSSKHAEKNENKLSPANQYVNVESIPAENVDATQKEYYDGENIKSKYSGFYVNGSQVSVMADTMIIPGTIAVMDKGSLTVYGKDGIQTSETEVWTDDVVLDGTSTYPDKGKTEKRTYTGSNAIFKANLYVKDDTELNAAGSNLQLAGSYYGYGDSTEKDNRKFTPVVNAKNFQVEVTTTNADGTTTTTTENRGHYNSSAIIVNGEQTQLDLVQAKNIFLAGRTYIELSKDVNTVTGSSDEKEKDAEGNELSVKTVTDVYTYHPTDYDPELPNALRTDSNKITTLRDYKMGESISIKSNQLAYIPVTSNGIPTLAKDSNDKSLGYYLAELPPALKGSTLFEKYFPEAVFAGNVPCVLQEVSGKKYYYYDFVTAYNEISDNYTAKSLSQVFDMSFTEWQNTYPSPQYFAAGFISDYSAELELHRKYVSAEDKRGKQDSVIAAYLVDIGDYEDFDAGNILLPSKDNKDVNIYSSGAITAKTDSEFSIVRKDDVSVISKLLTSEGLNALPATGIKWDKDGHTDGTEEVYASAYQLSDAIELEYEYMKWNLGHFSDSKNDKEEKRYIKDLVADENFGDASITPINKFLDMSKLDGTKIYPNLSGDDSGTNVMDLASKYSVWVSDDDVVVKARSTDNGKVRGIVITKGNVYFDKSASNGVTDFEGAIIAGGKVYVNGNVKTIAASAEICRSILRECLLTNDDNSKYLLSLFRGYAPEDGNDDSKKDDARSIDTIDYTDVVSFSNWMKNVE